MSSYKARAIFTNDAACDDMSTLAYLLLYANDIDIEGLVLSGPAFRTDWDQAAGKGSQGRACSQRIWECLDAYGRVWPNLVVHDGAYPTPDALRRATRIDSVREAGRTYADTEGAELIRKRILAQDPRPLYLLAAGGTDAIARALRRIEEDWQGTCAWDSVYRQVCDSAIILMDCARDDAYRDYIALTWPGLRTLHRTKPEGAGFRFDEASASCEQLRRCREAWPKPHLADKGPLMALCHIRGDARTYSGETCESRLDCHPDAPSGDCRGEVADVRGALAGEGVCPGFLHLVDKGLRSLEDPTFGGWGGRFVRCRDNDFNPRADYWRSAADDSEVPMGPGAWQEAWWAADWHATLRAARPGA